MRNAWRRVRRLRVPIFVVGLAVIGWMYSQSGGAGAFFHVVNSLQFSPEGKFLAVGSYSGREAPHDYKLDKDDLCTTVELIGVEPDKRNLIVDQSFRTNRPQPMERSSPAFGFSKSGTELVDFTDQSLNVWQIDPLKLQRHYDFPEFSTVGIACSNDGMVAIDYGGIHIRDASTWKELHHIDGTYSFPQLMPAPHKFSPDGTLFAYAVGSKLEVISTASWEPIHESVQLTGNWEIQSIAFSPDGNRIAAANRVEVRLYDLETGAVRSFSSAEYADHFQLAFLDDGQSLLIVGTYGIATMNWNSAMLYLRKELLVPVALASVAVSPDGSQFATGDWHGVVTFWDARSFQRIRTIQSHCRYRIPWTLPAALLSIWLLAHWVLLRRGLLTTDRRPDGE